MRRAGTVLTAAGAAFLAFSCCLSCSKGSGAGDVVADGGGDEAGTASGSSEGGGGAGPDGSTLDANLSIQPPIDDADTPPSEAGPGGPWVAFASTRTGNFDLFLVHPDGTGLRPLVTDPSTDFSPAWAPPPPNGASATVAFASNRSGAFQLYVVDVASGVVSPLATGTALAISPAYSPDGAWIAFGGDGAGGGLIYKVPAAGGQAVALTTGSARDSSPTWAPDGSSIYFATDRAGAFEVWSVKPDGTSLTQVTTGASPIGGPAISPDGKTLAYAKSGAAAGSGSSTNVVLELLSTGATHVLSALSATDDAEPAFAKNGRRIALTSTRYAASNQEIVLVDLDGANPFRLTNDPAVDGQAAFQPEP